MKVTAKMIAEQLGLSIATVDRALNNRSGVSPKTLKKVMEKAKELNYKPNMSASFLSRKKQVLLAIVFPKYPEYFWKEIEIGIMRAFQDLRDYGFEIDIIRSPEFDIEEQIQHVKDIIHSDKYDGLLLSANDAAPFIQVINTGIDNGFPIYTFNNDSPSSNRLSYVGADYQDSGRLAGELLYKFTHISKKFVLITDKMNTFQMQQKVLGFIEYMSQCNEVESIRPLKINSKDLKNSLTELQKDLNDVDGIYVAAGVLAEVAMAIEKMKLSNEPILIGHDMNKEIHHYLENGIITATICQDPVYQGSLAVKKVFNHLMLGNDIEPVEDIVKLEIVTKGNVKYYLYQ
ncbi:LacI family DNA-binding transcriptional regulator [Metabacillus arenae]|uniref:LacI family DNA-binding transcriptional regulator n=1 Tax=Metabacillus arenae TaxID=2771434 RepID=A0A926NT32_9BACI|nr:LacI family DNA-binding transcriptional regulator [Metabacillus arenae]MBD1383421.1 LacI family DNA-binding transcriptional regulator [Metabacillus arenae]